MSEARKVALVAWYGKTAVYIDGSLALYADIPRDFRIIEALGFARDPCMRGRAFLEIPTMVHNYPEFREDLDAGIHWKPPQDLARVLGQLREAEGRLRDSEAARLRARLADLEGGCGVNLP